MVLVPFAWALLSSVKTSGEIFGSPWSLPESPSGRTSPAWDKGVGQYLLNSVIVVTGGVVLTMLLGSMAAYVLARYRFPGNRPIYYLFAAGMMFPVFLAIVPLFFVVQEPGHALHLPGTDPGLRRLLPAVHRVLHARSSGRCRRRSPRPRSSTAARTPACSSG